MNVSQDYGIVSLLQPARERGGSHVSASCAPLSYNFCGTKTIPIYKAVPAHAEMERPPPVRGEGCCTITGSLAQRCFPNDVILHAIIGPAWPAEVLR